MYRRAKAASKEYVAAPPALAPGGNQWLKTMLKMPVDMVTGTVKDLAALANGTFSDEVRPIP